MKKASDFQAEACLRSSAPFVWCVSCRFRLRQGDEFGELPEFWAVAARWNSSRAPFGPRTRSRSPENAFKMREEYLDLFRCRHDVRPSADLAMSRTMSRAPSSIERGTFRAGALGQQRCFSEHTSMCSSCRLQLPGSSQSASERGTFQTGHCAVEQAVRQV